MGMMVNQATVLLYNFAIANLEVIGNWLTKDNVNLIKRQYAQYDVLARTMDLTGEFKTRFAREVQPLLAAFADDLKAKSSDQSEDASVVALRGAVLEELLRKLDTLAASVLGLQPDAAKRVFVALGSKDALSAEALQTLLNSNGHGSPADAPATVTAAPAPTTRQTKATKATKAAATAEPAPQSGRKETTSEETSSTASVVDVGTPASPVPNVPSATAPAHQLEAGPSETTDAAMETISQNFIDRLVHWCNLTRISQWLRFSNETTIPYLFWLELPPEILESRQHGMWNLLDPELGELTAEQSEIRAIGYRMTALLSGQLGGVIVTRDGKPTSYFPFAFRLPEDSTWRQAAMIPFDSTNVLYNIWDDNLGGVTGRSMDMSLGQDDLLTVLRNPELVGPWMAFCQAYDQWGKCLEQYRRERGATNDLIDLQS
jgi:hypothetical protein